MLTLAVARTLVALLTGRLQRAPLSPQRRFPCGVNPADPGNWMPSRLLHKAARCAAWSARLCAAICGLALLSSCDAPADPEGTTNRIRATHLLRAGASTNRPWIWFEAGNAAGPEARLIEDFAA